MRTREISIRRVRTIVATNIVIATGLQPGDTQNGVVLAAGDYVALNGQNAPAENGVYEVRDNPRRAHPFNSWDAIANVILLVEEGSASANTLWAGTSAVTGTIGTTAITFAEVGAAEEESA